MLASLPSFLPGRRPLTQKLAALTPLSATLTLHPTSVHPKELTSCVTPLFATVTENRGCASSPIPASLPPTNRPYPLHLHGLAHTLLHHGRIPLTRHSQIGNGRTASPSVAFRSPPSSFHFPIAVLPGPTVHVQAVGPLFFFSTLARQEYRRPQWRALCRKYMPTS
jgi:hypothetical protein